MQVKLYQHFWLSLLPLAANIAGYKAVFISGFDCFQNPDNQLSTDNFKNTDMFSLVSGNLDRVLPLFGEDKK